MRMLAIKDDAKIDHKDDNVTAITLTNPPTTLSIGDSVRLIPTLAPLTSTSTLFFEVDNDDLAEVDSHGIVTANRV
jgi:hypothetical protein